MTLSDGDIAALARQVVDLRDPDLEVTITPAQQDDPYRWGTPAWTVSAGGVSSYVTANLTTEEALDKLTADLVAGRA